MRARKLSTSASGSASSHSSTTEAPHASMALSTAWLLQNSASEYFSPRLTVLWASLRWPSLRWSAVYTAQVENPASATGCSRRFAVFGRAMTRATGFAVHTGAPPAPVTRGAEVASAGDTAVYSDMSAASRAFGATGRDAAASSAMRVRR